MRHVVQALLAAAVMATVSSAPVHAGTYRIGTGCSFATLGAAMAQAAAHDFDAEVTFKLRSGTELTGLFGPNYGYASIEVYDPRWDIVIEGGYADCSAATPGGFTTLKPSRAGDGHLLVDNTVAIRRSVTLRRLHLVDATDSKALYFWDNVAATLGTQAEVSNNAGGISLSAFVAAPSSDWPRLTLTDGARAHDNAGPGIAGLGTVILAHAAIDHNHATNGAGVYLGEADSQLVLDSSTGSNSISENIADINGGGIYLDHAGLVLKATTGGGYNDISLNSAGTHGAASTGYGGGIYSDQGNIAFRSGPEGAGSHNLMNGNRANYGGAIAVDGANAGSGVPYTTVLLLNSAISGNSAYFQGGALYSRNAVDWTIDRGDNATCGADFPVPCSVFANNSAQNGGIDYDADAPHANGGVIHVTDQRSDGYSRGIARFYRTLFTHNSDPQGSAAVAAATSAGELVFQRNVFDNNSAYLLDIGTCVLDSRNTKDVDFRYNTVLPSNTTYYVLHTLGGTLDLTGSVIETPLLLGFPAPIWLGEGAADVLHHGCLVSSVALADMNGDRGWVGDARIDTTDFAPGGGSPALDHCDYIPPVDFYNLGGAYDVKGVPARFGNYDLGAVEQRDVIFSNDFGNRPNG